MKFLLFGDFVKNSFQFVEISERLKEFIDKYDYVICNLEGPVITKERKALVKAGPHVRNSSDAIKSLNEMGVNIVLLGNNHIMDYGVLGLRETESALLKSNIKSVGVGDFSQCYKPLVIGTCSIINASQLEFGGVKEIQDGVGFAWFRHDRVFEMIAEEKARGQYCIVIPHAGLENEMMPLPEIRKLYRAYLDYGADIIVGGHPHIIQGMEIWNRKPIYYSLGNLWFDTDIVCDLAEWNRSMYVSVDTETGEYKHGFIKRVSNVLDFDSSEESYVDFENRSKILCDEKEYNIKVNIMVEKTWNDYYKNCYLMLAPYSAEDIWGNLINIMKGILRPRKRVFNETMLLHNIQIEPHLWCVWRYLRNKNRSDNVGIIDE